MIKIENLEKYFFKGLEKEVHALKNINLEIKNGEYVALSGASGCGKTTLLNAIGLLDDIDSGKIYFDNQEVTTLNEGEKTQLRLHDIGFIFQAYNLLPVLNVEENIALIMQLRGFSKDEVNNRVEEVATLLQIESKLKSLPSMLSGGEQQRVAVARAVASKPKIILADEPTANLDSKNSKALMDMMQKLNEKEGVSVLFASHDSYVLDSVKRIIKLYDGAIVGS